MTYSPISAETIEKCVGRDILVQKVSPFLHTLESHFPNQELGPDVKVLNLGCGYGDETLAILRFFASKSRNNRAQVVGIDIDAEAIETAKRRYSIFGEDTIKFLQGDARHLDKLVDEMFNVVMILHPVTGGSEDIILKQMISQATRKQKTGDVFLITCYHKTDLYSPYRALIDGGYTVLKAEKNAHSTMSNLLSQYRNYDYVIVAQRNPQK